MNPSEAAERSAAFHRLTLAERESAYSMHRRAETICMRARDAFSAVPSEERAIAWMRAASNAERWVDRIGSSQTKNHVEIAKRTIEMWTTHGVKAMVLDAMWTVARSMEEFGRNAATFWKTVERIRSSAVREAEELEKRAARMREAAVVVENDPAWAVALYNDNPRSR